MDCERCGATIQSNRVLCRDCASEPPRRIRIAIGFFTVYWGFFLLFAYGITATTPSGPFTRLPIFFAIMATYLLWGLWNLVFRAWGVTLIVWGLFLVIWPLAVYASPHLPIQHGYWILPIPVFIWFVYHQHDLYLGESD